MKILIVTGLSGAGKTQVIKALEDVGYYCVDNMPPELIPKFAEICAKAEEKMERIAVVTDIRGGVMFEDFQDAVNELEELGFESEILFLEASNEALVKRYKETRRLHPSAGGGRIVDGIDKERELLSAAKAKAEYVIDTSDITAAQLTAKIKGMFSERPRSGIFINVMSFGFKYGLPLDADLVFDVRFLPNPFYIPELKNSTGLETNVHDYVMKFDESQRFLRMLTEMINFLVPEYVKEGKSQLVIAIGCTGGHHRSVTFAEELYKFLKSDDEGVSVTHRDINKGI
ncbi:MAG TPA: RNase adapter RapZ [Candidatus Monoglobus merdigallinarum]|uniref:RNase adapter RapZ n=1 Tax=Candidatus Monoglobus merdigallinarum TaxID=2838698 RepID=A0A9D1PPN9_9FIRM|nr:RNase adapter RapZ [Candidatus Monoglobus merdigallinarum]